jgi:hypothetical protein
MWKRRTRPARGEIDEAALALLARHGAQILATARRYAATPEDAEDAYQRIFEILLTKAPSVRENKLIHWLKMVVKQRRSRSPPPTPAIPESPRGSTTRSPGSPACSRSPCCP